MVNVIAYTVPHWCYIPALSNLSYEDQKKIAIPFDSSEDEFSTCKMYDLNYNDLMDEELRNMSSEVLY